MNELKVIKVAELRKKLAAIPGKILLAALALFFLYHNGNLQEFMAAAKEKPGEYAMYFLMLYGGLSYVYFFIRMFNSWVVGIVAAVAVVMLVVNSGKFSTQVQDVFTILLLFGGPVMDVLHLIHYHFLKKSVIKAGERAAEHAYGSGYDMGYDRGYDRAMRDSEMWRELEERERYRFEQRQRERYDSIEDEEYEEYEEEDYDEEEPYERDWDNRRDGRGNDGSVTFSGFFEGCKDQAAIKRRYHDLCKVYHPDSGNGSEEIFRRITEEYERIRE